MINLIHWLIYPEIVYATTTDPWPSDMGTQVFSGMGNLIPYFSNPVTIIIEVLCVCAVLAVLIRSIVHH